MPPPSLRLRQPRAARFPLNLPIRYRPPGESQWQSARTINISKSGLLFIGPSSRPMGERLEMEITLRPTAAKVSGVITCTATVVRREERPGEYAIAASIHSGQLVPRAS